MKARLRNAPGELPLYHDESLETRMTVTLLHPGEMGAAVGGCLVSGGVRVVWVSEGRSPASRQRAGAWGLCEVPSLGRALDESDAVLSICVPSGAFEVAREVASRNFRGVYVDANAIAPAHSREIGLMVETAGARFVDGGIIGLPPTVSRTTRLYLAGPEAARIAELFAGSQTHGESRWRVPRLVQRRRSRFVSPRITKARPRCSASSARWRSSKGWTKR